MRAIFMICVGASAACAQLAFAQSLSSCSLSANSHKNGQFHDPIQIELLPDGRNARLLQTVRYTDPCRTEWLAPAGSLIDGASIPRIAWSVVGGPYEGKYRDASVIHDVACDQRTRPWESVHEAFYFAMLARGTPTAQAKIMYAAVYHLGPRWKSPVTNEEPAKSTFREEWFRSLAKAIEAREIGFMGFPPRPVPAMSLSEIESWTENSSENK